MSLKKPIRVWLSMEETEPLPAEHIVYMICSAITYPHYSSVEALTQEATLRTNYTNRGVFSNARGDIAYYDSLELWESNICGTLLEAFESSPHEFAVANLVGILLERNDGRPRVFLKNTSFPNSDGRVGKIDIYKLNHRLQRSGRIARYKRRKRLFQSCVALAFSLAMCSLYFMRRYF